MKFPGALLACSLLLAWTGRGPSADLSNIERTITKEPAYKSKPRYCLLVFGPEAKTRIWLVFDGDVLYVDRNGNGDLTEKGESVEGQLLFGDSMKQIGYFFEVPSIATGKSNDASLKIQLKFSNDDYDVVNLCAGDKYVQTATGDESGVLKFSDRPENAPVLHLNGPLRMALRSEQTLTIGDKPQLLQTMIGTPGLGKGTFAGLNVEAVPKDIHPVAELEFPNKTAGGMPIKAKIVLDHRC